MLRGAERRGHAPQVGFVSLMPVGYDAVIAQIGVLAPAESAIARTGYTHKNTDA